MPGYWFMYNMYALARNSGKYKDRDKRIVKEQLIEPSFLAPDTVNEMVHSLRLFEKLTGKAWIRANEPNQIYSEDKAVLIGKDLLESKNPIVNNLEITAPDFENTHRQVKLVKVLLCYHLFKELIRYYAVSLLADFISSTNIKSYKELINSLPAKPALSEWMNIGGQLIRTAEIEKMQDHIRRGKIKDWEGVHQAYTKQSDNYSQERLAHSLAAIREVSGVSLHKLSAAQFHELLQQSVQTKKWMFKNIYESRAKDYNNPFRMMVYNTTEEMNSVIGKLEDNTFIKKEKQELVAYKKRIDHLSVKLKLQNK